MSSTAIVIDNPARRVEVTVQNGSIAITETNCVFSHAQPHSILFLYEDFRQLVLTAVNISPEVIGLLTDTSPQPKEIT